MLKEEEKEKEKIPRRLNEILIERIRKYQSQDFSQLINSPNDEDTNSYFLGGLINFDVEKNDNSEFEINNDLDKMTVNDIYIEPYQYNDYEELNEEEEEEENETISNTNKKNIIKYNFENDKNSSDNIKILLNEDFNHYLDLIQKNYKKFENNHFPKLVIDNNENKNTFIKNIRNKIYETKEGEKIIVNNEIYSTSLAYLKIKDIFYDMPPRYKRDTTEFTVDYNLLEETMENIFVKSREFIEMNSTLSTSMSKVLLYSNYLDKYIKDKLEPFDNCINTSFEKVKRDRIFISEIKTKTMQNSGNIILKRMKMNNTKKLIAKLNKYKNLKNTMNSLEELFSDPKKSEEIYDLINKCKEEIEKIKIINNSENNSESIIELFENKLLEYKNRNDAHMSGELSQVLYNYFNNFLTLKIDEEMNEEINTEQIEKIEDYEKYGITKFVLEKINSYSETYTKILNNINFASSKKEIEKINTICDYYIDGNLMNSIYLQLRDIFTAINEQVTEHILSIYINTLKNINENKNIKEKEKEKNDDEVDSKKENENTETENTENEKDIDINTENNETNNEIQNKEDSNDIKNENNINENYINENNENNKDNNNDNNKIFNYNDDIFILLCIILSKNKFYETINSFLDVILNKIENNNTMESKLKENIIKECQDIKNLIKENLKNISKDQIQKCLNKIAINDDIDTYIDNYYLVLEMIKDEISNYDNINPETKINNNRLIKIIIKAQKNFIEHWAKKNVEKFETDEYKSWEIIKNIPQKYQHMLNVYFGFDIESNCMKDETVITKFPLDKINLIKEALDEEENNANDNEENENKGEVLYLKDGDKPELKIKINKTVFDIINFSYDVLKMFTLFHKECYGNVFGNVAVIIISHLNYQTETIYEENYNEKDNFVPTQSEISMSYGIFLLIQYIYEHIKESEFFVEIAKNSKQKLIDSYLEITKNINNCLEKSRKNIENIIDNKCIKESLKKLKEIELPYYNMVSGEVPVKEYALIFVSSLKDIYENMINSYEDSFIIEMVNKALEEFFDKFEDFIFHGQKIEDENCLKQFKRDMIFLKKNLVFITILDLTDVKNRIDNINKSVLPESMLKTKKK